MRFFSKNATYQIVPALILLEIIMALFMSLVKTAAPSP